MPEPALPVFVLKHFIEGLRRELGPDTLAAVFEKASLPSDWTNLDHMIGLDEEKAAHTFSRLQAAMRIYYGRGARGVLFRIGSGIWDGVLNNASFAVRAQSKLVRGFPASARLKPALDILARILSVHSGDVTVHTLDLDLLFVDRASPTSIDQHEETPICFVTQGLIRECLFWAISQEFDIEELTCRAMGAKECEFKVVTGAKA